MLFVVLLQRFQKTYQALEQEGLAEKQQLVALHQQRVQAELNEKKRHSMEHYMSSLQKDDADVSLQPTPASHSFLVGSPTSILWL